MSMTSVQVLAGPGIVARFGDVLLWIEEGEAAGPAVASRLLELARELADGGDARKAGARVAAVLRQSPQEVPAMVLVAPTTDGLQAVVHGWGRLLADGVDIDGGWADRELPWTTALAAGRGGDVLRVPTPGSVLDLRRGSTPGGGAAVALAAREATTAATPGLPTPVPANPVLPSTDLPAPMVPAPVVAAPVVPTPVLGLPVLPVPDDPAPAPALPVPDPDAAAVDPASGASFVRVDLRAAPARRQPLPIGGKGGAAAPTVSVKGVACGRGHFNNPIALFCRSCGITMGQITPILQDGVRPSLGTLVLDDGTAFGLDTDHVVGTAPEDDGSVAAGDARAVLVADPTGQVAPVHAEVRLVGWDVALVARAPTFVMAPGSQQWMPAPPGQANPLPAGARVAVGQRTFVVESDARSPGS